MWTTLLIWALASACLALPSPQQNNGNLDGLISNVFGPGPKPAAETQTTPSAFPSPMGSSNVDGLIADVFGTPPPTTIVGTTVPQDDSCECVPYYQCRNGTIIEDGVGLIDLKIGSDASAPR